ncbi:hypothetical protein AYR54_04810 [Loigolactobacillus backii]|uniref:hypothetical protein n=1 Tax=Loigolactobacillus backii TaxID=375175 RepID=UPI0007F0C708|nr:hypothetical protein [Loigolactobacillus backii]ANK59628.1 hypothetical protein AYR52_04795 [Loigolactobacillus backii]ANK64622.1 hypothetical protein AYR54_04810 [Loigolactobacillus backii]ANK66982.1 hypothetical protein AYR55_04230 [Loigolactobacillus backii]OLF68374.1 hypothetical protein ACX53_11820 [Loigolactobacillus backii]PIO87631.1 hypothetical protein B8A32_11015 [Loigolactobacillus backii]
MNYLSYLALPGYPVDFSDSDYRITLKAHLEIRLDWLKNYDQNHTGQELPSEIQTSLQTLIDQLNA